eukprot:Opistho-2@6804
MSVTSDYADREQRERALYGSVSQGVDIAHVLGPEAQDNSMVVTWAGKTHTFRSLSQIARLFVIVALLGSCAVLALTIQRMATIHFPLTEDTRADFTYAVVLLFNTLFSVYYAVHGCVKERKIEILAYIIASGIVTLYIFYQFLFPRDDPAYDSSTERPVLIARFALCCVFEPLNIVLAFMVSREFGWLEFETVGAHPALCEMYTSHTRFLALLKFDLQLGVTLVFMSAFSGIVVDAELAINIAGLVLTLAWALLGYVSARREVRRSMLVFLALAAVQPAYDIFVVVRVLKESPDDNFATYPVVIAGVTAIVLRAALIFFAYQTMRNFNRGLKELLYPAKTQIRRSSSDDPERRNLLR